MLLVPGMTAASRRPTPPEQPAAGPGGKAAPFDAVLSGRFGSAPTGYALFWPGTRADAEPLPVVIFVHGFSAVNSESYRAWIEHIVRRGAIVIFPDYQTANVIETAPAEFQANAVAGIRAAVAMLETGEPVSADFERVAIVGHSLGGLLAVNIAAVAGPLGLPVPDAIMTVEPGGCLGCGGLSELVGVPYADLSRIDPETLALVVAGDEDDVVGETGAMLAWENLDSIPFERRDYILVRSDRTGQPPLIADHAAPQTGLGNAEVDVLDWYGFWKWFDLLTDCAFHELDCEDALGGSASQLEMGIWSNDVPVVQPVITDTP